MSRIFYYDAYKIEKGNQRTGVLVSGILHALLLLIILWRFLETPAVEEQLIVVELRMPQKEVYQEPEQIKGGGSSAGPDSEEAKEGGSKGQEAPPALEELEKQPDKIEVIKPTPIPTTPSPKPVVVPTPSPVKIDPPVKTNPDPAPVKTSPPVVTESPKPTENKPKPSSGGSSGSSGSASTGDDDAPGSGGSGSGSGAGGSGSGGASSGSGSGGGGNAGSGTGGGSGDGVGVDFDETGPLKRKVSKRASAGELAGEHVQSAVFNICINQEGKVTYIKYNSKLSKTRDKNFVLAATRKMSQYEFQKDPKAPRKECGTFTFQIDGVIYKLK